MRRGAWFGCLLYLVVASCGDDAAKPGAPGVAPGPAVTARPGATVGAAPTARPSGRLVILGFDGVDPDWLDKWMAEGKLPTLRELSSAHGGRAYRRLRSTNPPQSPVAWTSFATGTEPGDHGIFDFIARALPAEGLVVVPKVATTSFEVQDAGPPVARNLRTGQPFWQLLGNAGVRVVALNVPYSFPPDPMRDGRLLSGLGTPDLRETNSTFTYAGTDVTPEEVKRPPGGGAFVRLEMRGGAGSFELEGPSIPGGEGKRMTLPVEIKAGAPAGGMTVAIAGKTVPLEVGRFSDWIEVEFAHAETRVRGILRLAALETGARTRLFVTPIGFHPRAPYSPISYPREFSGELADGLGHFYKTVGWDHDTSALNAEVIDDGLFLADVDSVETDRKRMLFDRLGRKDWDLLIWVSVAPDRVQHMFHRLLDPEHPRHDKALAARHGNAIENEYRRMDATVAAVRKALVPDDTLVILSDHGTHDFRRGLHVNQWLRTQGLLALKDGAEKSAREFLLDVDWSGTRAYALGTGQVYLNRAGREREGVVTTEEAPALIAQIRTGLLALRDAERGGAEVVRQVYLGADVFRGKRAADAPDLQMAFAENYRTSWETILGGIPGDLFADNTKKWSGDHSASDVEDTHGILVTNRIIARENPAIVDVAPTALAHFAKPSPPHYAGKSFFTAP
jgi:predicted AlkP superfamily phosphohydrolase/phosphomutase